MDTSMTETAGPYTRSNTYFTYTSMPYASRDPVPVPPSLRDTLKILLEEELYIPGLDLLNNLLAQGISTTRHITKKGNGNNNKIYVPPPVYIVLLTTLLAHPQFTTHIPKTSLADKDVPRVPATAERVLQRYLALTAGIGSEIIDALTFSGEGGGGGRRVGVGIGRGRNKAEIFEDDNLELKFACEEGIFNCAADFWAVIGWGFTCACARGKRGSREKWMKMRWEGAWRRWIDVVLEMLERDWVQRGEVEKKLGGRDKAGALGRKGALVMKYLPETMGGAGMRRVARAIFANGTGRMAKEWKEVWAGEAAPPVAQTDEDGDDDDVDEKDLDLSDAKEKTKNTMLILGKGKKKYMGTDGEDYLEKLDHYWSDALESSQSEEGGSSEGDTISVGIYQPSKCVKSPVDSWGGMEAVLLRRRFILLLSDVCSENLFLPIDTLYHTLSDHIWVMPIPEFALFVSTSTLPGGTTVIPRSLQMSHSIDFSNSLLYGLIESDAPMLSDSSTGMSIKDIVTCYLPFGAKSGKITDNAMVGILIEGLMRQLLVTQGPGEVKRSVVVNGMNKGVQRRRRGVKGNFGGKRADEESLARKWLEETEDRISGLVRAVWGGDE